MAAGDTIIARLQTKVSAADALADFIEWAFTNAQSQPIWISLPMDSPYQGKFTLEQTTGVARTIPWRVDSVGAITVKDGSSQLSVINTEHTLSTIAASAVLSLIANLGVMVAGDVVELRAKTRILSAGTTRECLLGTYTGVQAAPVVQSIPVDSPFEATFTLKQTAGSVHTYPWRVDEIG